MSRYNGIRPVTNGLVFCIDPTNRQSYTSGSTIVYDLANTTTGATLFNGPTFSTGSTSNFITFDGTNDYFSSSYVHTQSNHTVIAIVKLSTLNDDWIPIIEFNGSDGSNRVHYYVQGYTNIFNAPYSYRGFGANFYNGTVSREQWFSPVLYETNANEWMMLTGRVSGTTSGDTFVNKLKSRPTTGFTYSNIPITSIGNVRTGSFYYGGNLGLVLYYNRALTDNEIIQTYNAYKNRFNLPGDIVTNGLVLNLDTAYYNSYPRTGTTWSDLSGSGNNGTLTNGPTYVVTGASSSIQFDGVDDYVSISGLTLSTYSLNIAFNSSLNDNDRRLIGSMTNAGGITSLTVSVGNVLNTLSVWQESSQWVAISEITTNTNYILSIVSDQVTNTTKCYLNGIFVKTITNSISINSVGIGQPYRFVNGDYFSGKVYTCQMYNRALSESEIQQNFNALRGRFGI
jgi:hypothetical protein